MPAEGDWELRLDNRRPWQVRFCSCRCSSGQRWEPGSRPCGAGVYLRFEDGGSLRFSPDWLSSQKHLVAGQGFNGDDINDLKRAAKHPQDPTCRAAALLLLTYRIRGEAKAMLRTALADPQVYVRCRAAELLGILGDPNGLESLRRDFAELTKEGPDPNGPPKSWEERNRSDFWARQPNTRLRNALDVAFVLAEFGDTAGCKLASQTVLRHENPSPRYHAVRILTALGKIPDARLKADGCDLEAVLLAVVEKETTPYVLSELAPEGPGEDETIFGGENTRDAGAIASSQRTGSHVGETRT